MTRQRVTVQLNRQPTLFDVAPIAEGPAKESEVTMLDAVSVGLRDRRDVFSARRLAGLVLVPPWGIPAMEPTYEIPRRLIAFSEAVGRGRPDDSAWVHFFEDDYRFERFWKSPERYYARLRNFAGVISPDFSVYRNMPEALKVYNTYRNQLLGARLQRDGFKVIPNVRMSGRNSIPYALAGTPRESTIAIGLHGCIRDHANWRFVSEELRTICDEISPRTLVVYGSSNCRFLDYPLARGISVHSFLPDTFDRSSVRSAIA